MRSSVRLIHRILGILCAPVFFVLCVTGGIYLFRSEIERTVDSSRYYVDPPQRTAERLPIDELVRIVENHAGGVAESVCRHDSSNRTCRIILKKENESRLRLLYDVDPFTANIKGQGAEKTAPFFRTIKKIHSTLGLPKKIGRQVVLCVAALTIPLLLSGVILWTPVKKSGWKKWTSRMIVHCSNGKRRFLYDLHNTLGFFLLLPVLFLALTGVYLYFFPHGETLASLRPAGGIFDKKASADSLAEYRKNPLEEILKRKQASNPHLNQFIFRIPPIHSNALIRLEASGCGGNALNIADVSYWNPADGSLVAEKCYHDLSLSEQLRVVSSPYHNGTIFGLVSKILLLIVCFIAATLPLSGLCLFFQRKRPRKNNAEILR